MLPIKLEIKNFLAYRSPDVIRFDGVHLACLTGMNGAGKSSLLDAMTYALWGKARAGASGEELIHQGQGDMYIQLDFEQEGIIYQVVRRRARKTSTGSLELFSLNADGTRNNMNQGSIRATQAKIDEIIKIGYDTFVDSAFIQQGKADSFTLKPPGERKKMLAEILNLNRFGEYEKAAKEQIDTLEKDISSIDLRIKEIIADLANEPQLRTALAEAEAAQHDAEVRLVDAEARLKEVEHAPAALRTARDQAAALETRLRQISADLAQADAEITRQVARIQSYETIIAEQGAIEAGYLELQTARAAGDELADKLRQWSDLETRRHGLDRQLDAARTELKQVISGYEADVKNLEKVIKAAKTDDLLKLQTEIAGLQELEGAREAYQAEVVEMERTRSELTAENNALKAEMDKLAERRNRLRTADGAVCPVCGQPLSEAQRDDLIAEIEADGKAMGDQFRASKTRIEDMSGVLARSSGRLQEMGLEIKRMTQLEKQAGALAAGVEKAHEAALQLDQVQAELNAALGQLNGEQFAGEVRAQLLDLTAERDALGYDSGAHDEIQRKLQTYSAYEARQKELEVALAALPDLRSGLEGTELRRERLKEAQATESAAQAELLTEIGGLEALVKEHQTRDLEVRQLRLAERNAYDKLVSARQDLLALDDLRVRKADLEARLAARREERALYDELKQAFGKNGIPAMIIETAIPELEVTANRLLARMTDGRMNLTMSTQRERKDGGVIETLDIQIADELGTRAYELFSGGEAFRINFAIRVALSQMLARRAGAHLRTLFIDEGFGTQDDEGRNKLVEAITAVQDEFALILVVTHIEELRDQFPVHIAVEKTPDGSRISIR
ncbi:MAG: SMC family ATPase [Chloroflexi bacterium]|uniref:SMC family ATPase n=1 Tax=Candidatus Flexifilum breve TaxID=3140694 RepID=UPI0031364559|nr:SMC family ATPase [Chloroflexota bacterium]